MSELSRLLEDVYGEGGVESAALPAPPAWSSDEALEDTFASWVPGPPADAPAAERAFSFDDHDEADTDPDEQVAAEPAERSSTIDDVFAAFGVDDELPEPTPTQPVAVFVDDDDETDLAALAGTAGIDAVADEPEPVAEAPFLPPVPAPPILRWTPSDDDILPARNGSAKRRVKAAAPVASQSPSPSPAPTGAKRSAFGRRSPRVAPPVVAAEPSVEVEAPKEERRRGAGRRPAPKHAKPKATFQLSRKAKATPYPAEAPEVALAAPAAEAEKPKRKSFRLR